MSAAEWRKSSVKSPTDLLRRVFGECDASDGIAAMSVLGEPMREDDTYAGVVMVVVLLEFCKLDRDGASSSLLLEDVSSSEMDKFAGEFSISFLSKDFERPCFERRRNFAAEIKPPE